MRHHSIIAILPTFQVPAGTALLSRGKPVTRSDDNPIIGSLAMITDGEKKCEEGYVVEFQSDRVESGSAP